jgi:hypothetical protein
MEFLAYITCITIFKIDFQHVMEPNIWLSKVLKYEKRRSGDERSNETVCNFAKSQTLSRVLLGGGGGGPNY